MTSCVALKTFYWLLINFLNSFYILVFLHSWPRAQPMMGNSTGTEEHFRVGLMESQTGSTQANPFYFRSSFLSLPKSHIDVSESACSPLRRLNCKLLIRMVFLIFMSKSQGALIGWSAQDPLPKNYLLSPFFFSKFTAAVAPRWLCPASLRWLLWL